MPSVRKVACMMHYPLAHLATPLTARTHGEEKRDSKINSYYLNNDKQLTKIHRDTRNKPFEYKNYIVLEIFDFKMSKYVLS